MPWNNGVARGRGRVGRDLWKENEGSLWGDKIFLYIERDMGYTAVYIHETSPNFAALFILCKLANWV